ncbi:MAG: hypothetical protein FWF45_00990 [Coriobacteriia bacterium]|nr:hypothetical protein [Coriobacteriia bacterium]
MDLWNEQQPVLAKLSAEIEALNHQIDQMVYELYGLTNDEIKIIEGEG